MVKKENQAASNYDQVIDALHLFNDAADRVLAKELDSSLAGEARLQFIERKTERQTFERK